MAVFDLPTVGQFTSIEEINNYLYAFERKLRYLLDGHLNTKNINEVGGWVVDDISLSSGTVGMSSDNSFTNNVRLWAGSTFANRGSAPFRVYDNGDMYASSANLSGNINMSSGTITWGSGGVNPPFYTDLLGTKPPTNADNTAANLSASLGIKFTQIGGNYIYTGELSANQINAGTLSANYINGGTLSGVSINVSSSATVGNTLNIGTFGDTGQKRLYFRSNSYIGSPTSAGEHLDIYANQLDLGVGPSLSVIGTNVYFNGGVDFSLATVTGLNLTAKFG